MHHRNWINGRWLIPPAKPTISHDDAPVGKGPFCKYRFSPSWRIGGFTSAAFCVWIIDSSHFHRLPESITAPAPLRFLWLGKASLSSEILFSLEPSATIVNVCSSSRPLFLALSRLTDGLHKNEKGLHFNSRPENWPAPLCGLHCGNRGEVFVRRPSSCSSTDATNAIFFFFLHQNGFVLWYFFFPCGATALPYGRRSLPLKRCRHGLAPWNNSFFHPLL